jgi:hypothetical protein
VRFGAILVAAGIGILISKAAFRRDASEFGRRRHSPKARVWHDRLLRHQLVFGQVVGAASIVLGAVWIAVAVL